MFVQNPDYVSNNLASFLIFLLFISVLIKRTKLIGLNFCIYKKQIIFYVQNYFLLISKNKIKLDNKEKWLKKLLKKLKI